MNEFLDPDPHCGCRECYSKLVQAYEDLKLAYRKLDEEKLSLEWEVGELKSELKEAVPSVEWAAENWYKR